MERVLDVRYETARRSLIHFVYDFCILASAVNIAASIVTVGPALVSKSATLKDRIDHVSILLAVSLALGAMAWAARPCSTKAKAVDTGRSKFAARIVCLLLVVGTLGLFILGIVLRSTNLHRLPWDGLY